MALQLFFAWFTAWLALRFRRTMVFRALHPPNPNCRKIHSRCTSPCQMLTVFAVDLGRISDVRPLQRPGWLVRFGVLVWAGEAALLMSRPRNVRKSPFLRK